MKRFVNQRAALQLPQSAALAKRGWGLQIGGFGPLDRLRRADFQWARREVLARQGHQFWDW
jgi:hypothetical protein